MKLMRDLSWASVYEANPMALSNLDVLVFSLKS